MSIIQYADGEKQTVPLVTGRTADDWPLPAEAEEAFVGLQGSPSCWVSSYAKSLLTRLFSATWAHPQHRFWSL